MRFLAIIRYPQGGQLVHEFRCPLERASFVRLLKQSEPKVKVKLRDRVDRPDDEDVSEAQWYRPQE